MSDYSLSETYEIARGLKSVLWCILGNIVSFFVPPLIFLVIPVQLYFVYKLVSALHLSVPILWTLAMFIPVLSLILLLILSSKATTAIKARGFKVGLMGAKLKTIEEAMESEPQAPPIPQG